MSLRKILIPVGLVALLVLSYQAWAWSGVALISGGIMLWLLLHFNRLMQVARRAYNSPMGYVGSAVMLQSRLRAGLTLMQVMGLTGSLGEQLSAPDVQPEQYRWTDPSDAWVVCDFAQGRLVRWEFGRPPAPAATDAPPAP
jgi:hypothetical protein